jgi:putative transposase
MVSLRRQCELLGLHRSGVYYQPHGESAFNLELMRLIDEEFMRHPFLGSRRMTDYLCRLDYAVNRKRIQRLMRLMGLEAVYAKPRTSKAHPEHVKYPYLLLDLEIVRPNQVWATDVTYIPMRHGFLYLVAIMDWFSRYVLAWRLANTLDTSFCLEALEGALEINTPEIFNSDQGSQFTSHDFTDMVKAAGARMSMDGKGRCFDNIFVERLWRSVKYEEVYLNDYVEVIDAHDGLGSYFNYYNLERPHQSLTNMTPAEVYFGKERGAQIVLN